MTQEHIDEILAKVKKKVPEESDETLLIQLIEEAESYILAYTGRSALPEQLISTAGELAVVAYNRLGTEGDSGRSEGGESYTFDAAPHRIFSILNLYRLVRVSGKHYEAE